MNSSTDASYLGDRNIPDSVVSHQSLRKSIMAALFYLIRLLDFGANKETDVDDCIVFFDIASPATRLLCATSIFGNVKNF